MHLGSPMVPLWLRATHSAQCTECNEVFLFFRCFARVAHVKCVLRPSVLQPSVRSLISLSFDPLRTEWYANAIGKNVIGRRIVFAIGIETLFETESHLALLRIVATSLGPEVVRLHCTLACALADCSATMRSGRDVKGRNIVLLDVVVNAVIDCINSLSARDSVNVLVDDSGPARLLLTANTTGQVALLYQATKHIRALLVQQLLALSAASTADHRSSDFDDLFTKAFDALRPQQQSLIETRPGSLILLSSTYGSNTGSSEAPDELVEYVASQSVALRTKVLTVALGPQADQKQLARFACAAHGVAVRIDLMSDALLLRRRVSHALREFFETVCDDRSSQLSSPYIDALGLGLVVTISLAVRRSDSSLIGVVASDILLQPILDDLTRMLTARFGILHAALMIVDPVLDAWVGTGTAGSVDDDNGRHVISLGALPESTKLCIYAHMHAHAHRSAVQPRWS